MIGLFKNLMGGADNGKLKDVIKEGAFLVDVRTPAEFSEGTAKGAVNVPLDRLQTQLSKFKGKKTVVVFCRSGARSGQAKSILERNGIQNVVNGGSVFTVIDAIK